MTVFVVSAAKDVRTAVCLAVRPSGVAVVVEAASGAEALEAAGRMTPDVVLIDMTAPHAGGHEALRMLRESPLTSALPVILLAAGADSDTLDALRDLRSDAILTSPADPETLPGLLHRVLRMTRRSDGGQSGTTQATDQTPKRPDVDTAAIRQLRGLAGESGGDLVDELIELFGSNTVKLLSDLRNLAGQSDSTLAARLAHSLAGSASTVGATGIADQARLIERLALQRHLDQIPALVDRIAATLDATLQRLRTARDEMETDERSMRAPHS